MSRKVLHVVESLSSGVATAIEAYVENRPLATTHVVYGYRRPGVQVGDGLEEHAKVVELPGDRRAQLSMVRAGLKIERPDVIHVHSSWAGLAVRSLPRPRQARIVYTPHCFAFERLDLSDRQRQVVRIVEKNLMRRTDAVAAVGRYEATLARQLSSKVEVIEVPHALPARVLDELVTQRASADTTAATGPDIGGGLRGSEASARRRRVCALGRLSPQKDVEYFLEVVKVANGLVAEAGQAPFEWTWIGGEDSNVAGGTDGYTKKLAANGVRVTGWIDRRQALAELAGAEAYLHTAAWEGFPLTVLEAAELDLPVVARTIPSLTEMDLPTMGGSPADLAELLVGLSDPARRFQAVEAVRGFRAQHRAHDQRQALARVYQVPTLTSLSRSVSA